ncbi:MAG: tungsten ABC transporter substrate-binding protein, partial [Shewanella sp.]
PDLNHKGAKAFSDWLISKEGQQMINSFKVEGEQLFKATYSE